MGTLTSGDVVGSKFCSGLKYGEGKGDVVGCGVNGGRMWDGWWEYVG
jgi:hypothetical protein